MRRLNPLRAVLEPLALGFALGVIGFVFELPLLAAIGAVPLIVVSVRIAYDHGGAAGRVLPFLAPLWRTLAPPLWCRQQVTGSVVFFFAVWLVVGSLRGYPG